MLCNFRTYSKQVGSSKSLIIRYRVDYFCVELDRIYINLSVRLVALKSVGEVLAS
jgi:hypothetical protein